MYIDDMALDCCALCSISGFGEYPLSTEWGKQEWREFLEDLKGTRGPVIATLNRYQRDIKKELVKHRFKVIGTIQSKEGNGTIWIMGRGIKTPRTKRGRHAKHR